MLSNLKRAIARVPGLGGVARNVYRSLARERGVAFTTSGQYWDARYKTGGNSGAGSYNDLAKFKAEVLNDFVKQHQVRTVMEFGSGDGAQLALAEYPHYIGLDVSPAAIARCNKLYESDPTKQFHITTNADLPFTADLTLSLDVVYHLVEDEIFKKYMSGLFDASTKYVIVYASNDERPSPGPHVRHRHFTKWVELKRPSWRLKEFIKNRFPWDEQKQQETSFADFYIFEKS